MDALQKTAKEDGWLDRFLAAKGSEHTLRKLVRDFQTESPSKGKGRPRAKYNKARAMQIIANEQIEDEGTRCQKMDWFEFETFYQGKRMSQQSIEAKWKQRLADEGPLDTQGENPDYPERLLVRVQDYVDAKQRKRTTAQVAREMADKKMLGDEGVQPFLENEVMNRPTNFFSSPTEKMLNDPGAGRPSRRRSTGSAASSGAADEEKVASAGSSGPVGDLTVSRLRAFEETGELMQKVLSSLAVTVDKVDKEATCSVAAVSGWLLDCRKLPIWSPKRKNPKVQYGPPGPLNSKQSLVFGELLLQGQGFGRFRIGLESCSVQPKQTNPQLQYGARRLCVTQILSCRTATSICSMEPDVTDP